MAGDEHHDPTGALAPLYMWAGGKTRLLRHYRPVLPTFDPDRQPYVEPFFGGGAVFCDLTNRHGRLQATIGDVNTELIGVLTSIRADPDRFTAQVTDLADQYLAVPGKAERKAWYYAQRAAYWADPDPATLFVLMRLGFNGIWQTCTASKGLFATPAGLLGHTRPGQIIRPGAASAWADALATTTIHAGTYATVALPDRAAFVYLDPPYRGSHTTYGTGFDDTDQAALVDWARAAARDGHTVALANRCVDGDPFFEELLPDATFHYFDVTYTAGRRKQTPAGYHAKAAREFLAVL